MNHNEARQALLKLDRGPDESINTEQNRDALVAAGRNAEPVLRCLNSLYVDRIDINQANFDALITLVTTGVHVEFVASSLLALSDAGILNQANFNTLLTVAVDAEFVAKSLGTLRDEDVLSLGTFNEVVVAAADKPPYAP